MPTAKDSVVINLKDATSAMPVATYGEVIVVGPHTNNTKYNVATKYSSQAAVEADFGAGSVIAKATAKVFAQGVPHVRVMNVYKDEGTPEDYSTCLATLESQEVDYDIIVPTEQVDDANFGLLVTHATTYKKVLICAAVYVTKAQAIAKMVPLTKDETQYAIVTDSSANVVGELAGAAGGVISTCKPWIPPEWVNVAGINPAGYTPDDIDALETDASNNVNTIITVGTATVLSSGKSLKPGSWIDVMRTKQYLADSIRNELLNLKLRLANSNQKIPYSPAGLKMVQSTIEYSCRLAQKAGALREDYVENGAVVKGYTVAMPAWADISGSDKTARLLQNITVTAYLSGAVSKISMDLVITL